MKTNIHLKYVTQFFLELEMLQTKVVEKIKTQILYSITFFFKCAFYEIMWKNTAELGTSQMIRHTCTAGWIRRATNTCL